MNTISAKQTSWLKRILKVLLILVGVLIVLLLIFAFVVNKVESANEKKMLGKLSTKGVDVELGLVAFGEQQIRVARAGNREGKKLLLIHGSPGDWTAWENILSDEHLLTDFDMVAIDRPGYGQTTIPAQSSLEGQSRAAIHVAHELWRDQEYLVAGHSYGGAVAEDVLLNEVGGAAGALFVAATLSPTFQAPKWYNKLGKFKAVNWLLSPSLKSSNIEMMGLKESLLENEPMLPKLIKPMVLIQGRKDVLVPYKTADYFKEHTQNHVEYMLNDTLNHFIPWSNPELIVQGVLKLDHFKQSE